jgi:hypothetical protein
MHTTVNKAVVAFLSSLVALLAAVNVPLPEWLSAPEFLSAVGPLVASLLVGFLTWLVPNRPAS